MTDKFRFAMAFLTACIMLVTIFTSIYVLSTPRADASAPTGLKATVASTTLETIGTAANTLVATSSNCSSRVISTYAQPVMLTFSDYAGQTPTALFGFLQAASTTVVYDSGLYGCGLIKGISATGVAGTATVSDVQ